MNYRKINLPVENGKPKTVDEENRSVEVVGTTEQPVEMYDWRSRQTVDEILLISGAELPKSRQVPLLDTHYRWDTASVLGSYRDINADGDQLLGRAFFSTVPEAEGPWTKVREGHLTDFSAGYRTMPSASVMIPAGDKATVKGREFKASAERPLVVRTRWSLKELSVVPIGADDRAKARTDNGKDDTAARNVTEENSIMENNENSAVEERSDKTPATVVQMDPEALKRERREEQLRVREIMAYGEQFGCRDEAMAAVNNETSVDDFRKMILERHVPEAKPVETPSELGLTDAEKQEFSVLRLIRAMASSRQPNCSP